MVCIQAGLQYKMLDFIGSTVEPDGATDEVKYR
jgi:hypothetical protein